MGCIQSKKKYRDVLLRCKERKKVMELAIASWEAVAAAYSEYSLALKNVGAALGDYSQWIAENSRENPSIFREKGPNDAVAVPEIPVSPHFKCSPIPETEEECANVNEADSTPLIGISCELHYLTGEGNEAPSDGEYVKAVAEIMNDLDRHFLEASGSSRRVLEILEPPHIGYDARTDYSAQVMKAILWSRSSEGTSDECEVLASILEWENRLCSELKALESDRVQYERKSASLKAKKRGASESAIGKARAAVGHFQARYRVSRESVDSVVSEINRLRDVVLYRKLASLADGMAVTWESIHEHHHSQHKIVSDRLRGALNVSLTPAATSQQHRERTALLSRVLKGWHSQFQNLVIRQKTLGGHLGCWAGLTQQKADECMEEGAFSLPVRELLVTWEDELNKLPSELCGHAIEAFADVIRKVTVHHEDELSLRTKCEEIYKECLKKEQTRDALKRKLEKELESYEKVCQMMKESSVHSLTTHLEELLRSLSEFALASSEMYKMLRQKFCLNSRS